MAPRPRTGGPLLGTARQHATEPPAARPFVKVPWNHAWTTHDKLDIKAIYRRPRYTEDKYGDSHREYDKASGAPTWDLTSGLPVRYHARWAARGFQYVTLASQDDLAQAAKTGTLPDPNDPTRQGRMSDYQNHRSGPWNAQLYLENAVTEDAEIFEALRADVAKWGPDAVEAIRRSTDPGFELPANLR